jgi:hypothetical protein
MVTADTAEIPTTDELDQAAAEIDVSLLAWFQTLSPRERLRAASQMASTLDRFRRVAPKGR